MLICVHTPHFVAQREQRWRDLPPTTPLVVVHGTHVVACSRAAAAQHVQPGMTVQHAHLLCPDARVVPAAPIRYSEAIDDVTALLASFATRVVYDGFPWNTLGRSNSLPRHDQARWLLDPGSMGAGALADHVRDLRQALTDQHGLPAAIAVAPTRFTSACAAAQLAPGGVEYVPAGQAAHFIAPLPLTLLPLDRDQVQWFRRLGLHTLGQVSALPAHALHAQLGPVGRLLHTLASGKDTDPIPPYVPLATLQIRRSFEGAVYDRRTLVLAGQQLAARMAERLAHRGTATQRIGIELELEDVPTAIAVREFDTPTSQAEVLTSAAGHLLARAEVAAGVEALTLVAANLTPLVSAQLDLFGESATTHAQRHQSLRQLITRFGRDRFVRAVPWQRHAPLPEHRFHLEELSSL
ncbi:MAG: hypothetical protein M3R24_12165 [Chloroflexota bacterium]|nr:hypothetical protein [Chloroflexota bacterium]